MKSRFAMVEAALNRAEFRWKWRRLAQHTFVLGAVLALAVFGLGVLMANGTLRNKGLALALAVVLAVTAVLAWCLVAIAVCAGSAERSWLAAALERVDSRFLDRLNTLLFLEKQGAKDSASDGFALRIARQAHSVLAEQAPASPFSSRRALLALAVFAACTGATIWLYVAAHPWESLLANAEIKPPAPESTDATAEAPLPATNNLEQNQAWGEVRITDPGSDLKVTKVDVVPLQIEAAANQALKKVEWASTVNGSGETTHELPAPREPRYAAYKPTLYLDELNLSDWDVLSYFAKANAGEQQSFASEVYFLEVRPFREDILKMPGGANGQAYRCINELSMLINHQEQLVRQTHQYVQNPQIQAALRAQDRNKLTEAQNDVGDSTRHLYSRMASELENRPIGDALDNLARAEQSMTSAAKSLSADTMPDAQQHERTALSGLVAARKAFQKAVSEHPDAFAEQNEDEPPSTAEPGKTLKEIAEFRNESQAARDFVEKTLQKQKTIEQKAGSARPVQRRTLGREQRDLAQGLRDFQEQHSRVFKPAEPEAQAAGQAMSESANSLDKPGSETPAATREAVAAMEKLNNAMAGSSASRQLTDAYRLRKMLENEINTLGQGARGNTNVSDSQLQAAAGEARETVNQLKAVAEQEPTRDAFGDALRQALSGQNKVDLDARLSRVQQAPDPQARKESAGPAGDALSAVNQAFSASEPKTLQAANKSDALQPGADQALGVGMAELESLLKLLGKARPISKDMLKKQANEALLSLQSGLRSHHGSNERGEQLLLHLQEQLQAEQLDPGNLKKLMDELQHFSVENSDLASKKEENAQITNIDPARLPPAYRGRIQKYFQKLSERQ